MPRPLTALLCALVKVSSVGQVTFLLINVDVQLVL